jgi:hypothetical protein
VFVLDERRGLAMEYANGSSGPPVRAVPAQALSHLGVAVDSTGNLYVIDPVADIDVYRPGANKPLRTVHTPCSPASLVIGSSDELIVAATCRNNYGKIYAFSTGAAKLLRSVRETAGFADGAAVDPATGNIAIGNYAGNVLMFTSNLEKLYTIPFPKESRPVYLAFDNEGNLFVGDSYNVEKFPPDSSTPTRTWNGGTEALAVDSLGNAYFTANKNTTVQLYAPGAANPTLTIATGIYDPDAIAINSLGDVFVAEGFRGYNIYGSVTVYAPGTTSPSQIIKSGIKIPTQVVIAP